MEKKKSKDVETFSIILVPLQNRSKKLFFHFQVWLLRKHDMQNIFITSFKFNDYKYTNESIRKSCLIVYTGIDTSIDL